MRKQNNVQSNSNSNNNNRAKNNNNNNVKGCVTNTNKQNNSNVKGKNVGFDPKAEAGSFELDENNEHSFELTD